ncbi:MAG TPA: sigma-70 family RNA polymerase sigma factor [Gaiellaceae bacterium]|nr:sigma-70 family RNA polymerase sigma factor [Gaiellaceae bacterium]
MASVAIDDRSSVPGESASRLFEEHSAALLRYCTRQLADREDAEDAVQTTFLYAFRALRRGVVPECERAWLTTIARNVCHSQRRTTHRHPEETGVDLERIALAQPDLEEVGFMDDLRAALSSLPETQRRALVLREWQGVPSSEIATELHLTEPATHALLFRARRSFTTAMTASRRPFAGLNVALLLDQLRTWAKPLFGGAVVKAAVVTTAAGVAVGGVVLEQRAVDAPSPPAAPSTVPIRIDAPVATAAAPRSSVEQRQTRASFRTGDGTASPATTRMSERRSSAPAAPAVGRETLVRPPRQAADTAPPPPATTVPSPGGLPAPIAPPPPAVPPVGVPPIAGQPPVEIPPPVEQLLPPVEVPPVPALPAPALPLL